MNAHHFLFRIILSNYVWSVLVYQNKDHNVRQIRFHVCIKMHRCKRRVYKRKTLSGQPNINHTYIDYFMYGVLVHIRTTPPRGGRNSCNYVINHATIVILIKRIPSNFFPIVHNYQNPSWVSRIDRVDKYFFVFLCMYIRHRVKLYYLDKCTRNLFIKSR